LLSYHEKDWPIYYWRTAHGAEVDLVIETDHNLWAIEIKSGSSIRTAALSGLAAFLDDYPDARSVCVGDMERPYNLGNIACLPWRDFFQQILAE
jgi:predicted AAA+ superfamily ATPase